MALTGNKGEWSEIYVLLKLLGDGEVHAGDENLNEIKDLVYPIVMILREESEGKLKYLPENSDVILFSTRSTILLSETIWQCLTAVLEKSSVCCFLNNSNMTRIC